MRNIDNTRNGIIIIIIMEDQLPRIKITQWTFILITLATIFHGSIGNPTVAPAVPVHLGTREHKVHNIMLYPEKHSWCKSTQIKQIVSHVGCKSIEMENNVCVGACFSFSVPRTIPETPGDEQLHYCDSCQPSKVVWATVSLECPENPTQPTMDKMVELIENCSCRAYGDRQSSHATNDQYLDEVGDGTNQMTVSSGEHEADQTDDNISGGGVVDGSTGDDVHQLIDDTKIIDPPQTQSGTDNNIPKFLHLKDVKMTKQRMSPSSRLSLSSSASSLAQKELGIWNSTTTSLIEDGIFLRPINTTIRDSILKSPGHQLLLRQLEEGNDDDDDDGDDVDNDDEEEDNN